MAKFKVRDRVKVIKRDSWNDDKYVGKTGEIINAEGSGIYPYFVEFNNGDKEYFADDEVELVSRSRGRPPKPVKYIAFYDEEDRDPAKKFTSRKELNEWLKEAEGNRDIIFSSIKVYEVKKEYEVLTSFKLKGI